MDTSIPAINRIPFQEKLFGFKIANNREILLNDALDYNPFRPHRIQFYAILFILEGEGVHFIDFKSYTYQKGSVIFISKEQVHAFEKSMERKAYFLLFTEDFLEINNAGSTLMQQLSLYNYHLYPPIIHLNEQQLALFATIVQQIKTEYDAPDDWLTEELIHAGLKVFLCLSERIRKENRKTIIPSKHREEFLQFQRLLKQHIFETRKVKFYADALLFSTKKLNRITQEMVNQPAKQYVHSYLLLEIKRYLMNTSLSVSEIAYQTGFEEVTNFVKYFKKHSTLSPTEFRQQCLI